VIVEAVKPVYVNFPVLPKILPMFFVFVLDFIKGFAKSLLIFFEACLER
jgi:hypothetical protein